MGLAGCTGSGDDTDTDEDEDNSDGTGNPDENDTGQSDTENTNSENSSDGDTGETNDGNESDDSDGTDDPGSPEFVQEPMGEIGTNAIDELEIVAWESEIAHEEFTVRVAVQNNGDQEADAGEYTYQIVPYDESGTEIEANGTTTAFPYPTQMSPGGVGAVDVTPPIEADPETVASYEIHLDCSGMFAEGVYCSS